MTTNKPKVVAYARTGALASILPRPWRLPVVSDWSPMYSDALIRLSDYEALQAELETVKKVAYGNIELLERNEALQAECGKLLEEVLRLRVAMAKASQRADDWPDSNDDPADVLSDCASILFDALDYRHTSA